MGLDPPKVIEEPAVYASLYHRRAQRIDLHSQHSSRHRGVYKENGRSERRVILQRMSVCTSRSPDADAPPQHVKPANVSAEADVNCAVSPSVP